METSSETTPRRRRKRSVWQVTSSLSVAPDAGCELWSSCLSCPLPRCVYDYPPEERRAMRAAARGVAD